MNYTTDNVGFETGVADARKLDQVTLKNVLALSPPVLAEKLSDRAQSITFTTTTRWVSGYVVGFLSVLEETRAAAAMTKTKRLRRILDDLCTWLAPMRNIDTYRFQQEAESECAISGARQP